MAYPVGVVTRTCTVGGATAQESGDPLILSVVVASSRGLIWASTGWRLPSSPEAKTSTIGSEVSFDLPVSDQSGYRDEATGMVIDVSAPNSHTHTYTATITTTRGTKFVNQRVVNFPLPTGDLSPVDVDTLIDAGTVDGVPVSVPDTWGAMVEAAQAAAQESADTAAVAVADYLTANPPPAGDDGREVELQTTATHVQWRYTGDATWLDLIPLALITGQDGSDGLSAELRTTATHIQWRQAGGAWADLIPLASLIGPTGPANTLTIGTVTTLAAGAPATAAITGTAPNQTLNLGLPAGEMAVTAWVEPSLLNSWVAFDVDRTPKYRKESGVVRLTGVIKSGAVPSVCMALPAGFRPSVAITYIPVVSNNAFGQIQIAASGAVSVATGSSAWVSLNCTFVTA